MFHVKQWSRARQAHLHPEIFTVSQKSFLAENLEEAQQECAANDHERDPSCFLSDFRGPP